jgi:hypothetical protein
MQRKPEAGQLGLYISTHMIMLYVYVVSAFWDRGILLATRIGLPTFDLASRFPPIVTSRGRLIVAQYGQSTCGPAGLHRTMREKADCYTINISIAK